MKDKLKPLLQDKFIRIALFAAPAVIFLQIMILAFFFRQLPPYIPFFNSMPWGEARIAAAPVVLSVPFVLFCIYILNAVLGSMFYKKHTLLARILSFNTLLCIFLGFMALAQILILTF